jgi:hypothetical protein
MAKGSDSVANQHSRAWRYSETMEEWRRLIILFDENEIEGHARSVDQARALREIDKLQMQEIYTSTRTAWQAEFDANLMSWVETHPKMSRVNSRIALKATKRKHQMFERLAKGEERFLRGQNSSDPTERKAFQTVKKHIMRRSWIDPFRMALLSIVKEPTGHKGRKPKSNVAGEYSSLMLEMKKRIAGGLSIQEAARTIIEANPRKKGSKVSQKKGLERAYRSKMALRVVPLG